MGDETGLDNPDPATLEARDATHFPNIIAARNSVDEAEAELRAAVAATRKAGDSRTVIGALRSTSPPAEPRSGLGARRGSVTDAVDDAPGGS